MKERSKIIDLYNLDDDLNTEQRQMVELVRRFVDKEVLPHINSWNREGNFPRSFIEKMSGLRILEALIDKDFDPISYGLIMRELERGGSTIRSLASVQRGLVLYPIMEFGSEEQKAKWVGPLSEFKKIGSFGLTEHDIGSNPAGLKTRAVKSGSGYKISGSKCWITNGTLADVAIIWAKLDGVVKGFLVETNLKGFTANSLKNKWSFRASDTAEFFLDDVEVPETALLPKATSLEAALKCLTQARYGIAWGVIGAARACLEETLDHLLSRTQFDNKPLASHQLIQAKLAWMATELTGMELIVRRLAELKKNGKMKFQHVSLAKMNNCNKALDIARKCRQLLGASGIVDELHTGRYMLDLETVVTYEGTEHIHELILGNYVTGIKAYS